MEVMCLCVTVRLVEIRNYNVELHPKPRRDDAGLFLTTHSAASFRENSAPSLSGRGSFCGQVSFISHQQHIYLKSSGSPL